MGYLEVGYYNKPKNVKSDGVFKIGDDIRLVLNTGFQHAKIIKIVSIKNRFIGEIFKFDESDRIYYRLFDHNAIFGGVFNSSDIQLSSPPIVNNQ